jgi:hypothetical protein
MTPDATPARINSRVDRLLSRLPLVEEHAGHGIVLTGRPIAGDVGHLHFLSGEFCFSFRLEDVLDIEVLDTAELPFSQEDAGTFRVLIRRGARVQDIRPGEFCDQGSPRRRPFALAVRPRVITMGPHTRFRDLEREFLLARGLIDE